MIITLPWPDKRVFPNAKRRKHWRTYQPAINADREIGAAMTLACLDSKQRRSVKESTGKIPITVTFYPPDRRLRDDDGMVGGFKHLRDGIADALGIDDRRFAPHYFFADPCKPGRIEVEVIPVIEAANCLPDSSSVLQESGPVSCVNSTPALTKTNLTRRLD